MSISFKRNWSHRFFQDRPSVSCRKENGESCGRGAFLVNHLSHIQGPIWECQCCGSIERATQEEIAWFKKVGPSVNCFGEGAIPA